MRHLSLAIFLAVATGPIFGAPPQPPPLTPSVANVAYGAFQKLAQERGAECYLQYPDHPPEKYGTIMAFALHQLKIETK